MNNIVFRTTNDCNLKCTYCYDENNHCNKNIDTKRKQSTNILIDNKNLIVEDVYQLLKDSKYPSFIFHGGEPLLVYPEALDDLSSEIKRRIHQPIRMSIQTNATLIDQKAINFFKNQHLSVGISLDGATKEQNKERIDQNGNSIFDIVLEKMEWLQEEDIKYGVVMSITKNHIGQEQQIYDFLAETGINCNIRAVFPTPGKDNSNILTTQEYITFFTKLFDIWYNDSQGRVGTYQISELSKALSKVILSKEKDANIFSILKPYEELINTSIEHLPLYHESLCSSSPNCFENFISLDCLGEVYACNRLYNIDKFHYGNIRYMSSEELHEKIKKLQKIRQDAIELSCGSCNEVNLCNGGCPAESYNLNGNINSKNISCEATKIITKHIKKRVLTNDNY